MINLAKQIKSKRMTSDQKSGKTRARDKVRNSSVEELEEWI